MTDELLEHCAKLPRLVAINANFSGVTDAGLAHLKGHKRLKELLLSQTSITDAGLAHLATIATLEKIDLEETKITDAGLMHLYALDKLKQVALRKTAVTENGVAELKKNRSPDVKSEFASTILGHHGFTKFAVHLARSSWLMLPKGASRASSNPSRSMSCAYCVAESNVP